MKTFACGDVVPGCDARFTATTEDGILSQVADHARRDHQMTTVPSDVVELIRSRIVAA